MNSQITVLKQNIRLHSSITKKKHNFWSYLTDCLRQSILIKLKWFKVTSKYNRDIRQKTTVHKKKQFIVVWNKYKIMPLSRVANFKRLVIDLWYFLSCRYRYGFFFNSNTLNFYVNCNLSSYLMRSSYLHLIEWFVSSHPSNEINKLKSNRVIRNCK